MTGNLYRFGLQCILDHATFYRSQIKEFPRLLSSRVVVTPRISNIMCHCDKIKEERSPFISGYRKNFSLSTHYQKRGKMKDNEEAKLVAKEKIALHDVENKYIASMTRSEAREYIRKNHGKQFDLRGTGNLTDGNEKIFYIRKRSAKVTSMRIATSIADADLQTKIATVERKCRKGNVVQIEISEKKGEIYPELYIAKVKKRLEQIEGLVVKQRQNIIEITSTNIEADDDGDSDT